MKTNKGAFDENGDAITRGYVEPKQDDVKKFRGNTLEYWKQNANENYISTPISVLKYITILEEALQAQSKQEESSNWDEIFEAWLHTKSHIDLSLEEVNCLKNWFKEHYNPPVKR